MKKTLFLIMVVILFFAFSCKNNNSEKKNKDNQSTKVVNSDSDNTNSNKNASYDFKELNFSENEIPDDLYVGKIAQGKKWQDEAGINYIIISEKNTKKGSEDGMGMKSYEIHGYHYIENNNDFELIREIKDFQYKCDLIIDCGLCENSLEVTDIDNDNYGEASFVYYLYCAMDLSPSTMKLMLLENGDKYPIRGSNYVRKGKYPYGGETNIGSEFNNAPNGFKKFALDKWNTFQMLKSNAVRNAEYLKQFEAITFAGAEPFWSIKFNIFGAVFEEMGGEEKFLEYTNIRKKDDGTIDITVKHKKDYWDIYIKEKTCSDGMSNNKYKYSIKIVKSDASKLNGCGDKL